MSPTNGKMVDCHPGEQAFCTDGKTKQTKYRAENDAQAVTAAIVDRAQTRIVERGAQRALHPHPVLYCVCMIFSPCKPWSTDTHNKQNTTMGTALSPRLSECHTLKKLLHEATTKPVQNFRLSVASDLMGGGRDTKFCVVENKICTFHKHQPTKLFLPNPYICRCFPHV